MVATRLMGMTTETAAKGNRIAVFFLASGFVAAALVAICLEVRIRVLQERIARLRSELASARSQVERPPAPSMQKVAAPLAQVIESFDMRGFTPDAAGECLVGSMGAIRNAGDERLVREPFKASQFEFGFSVKAKWYHGIVARFGAYSAHYSRGHWLNSATMLSTPGNERRFPRIVDKPDEFARVEARYDNGSLTFLYNGQLEGGVDIPPEYRNEPIVVGFCGYNSAYVIRDVVFRKR